MGNKNRKYKEFLSVDEPCARSVLMRYKKFKVEPDFVTIVPGQNITFNVDLHDFLDENQDPPQYFWAAIIDSWSEAEDTLKSTDFYVRKIKGVNGKFTFSGGGSRTELEVDDLLKDIFNKVGVYRMECEFENNVVGLIEFQGEKGIYYNVPGAWEGKLKSVFDLKVVK